MIEHLIDTDAHMPFLAQGPNGIVLLLCLLDSNGKWKIWFNDLTTKQFVDLQFVGQTILEECSPCGWYDGTWHFSFIGQNHFGGYNLFVASGDPSELLLIEPIKESRIGFKYKNVTAWSNGAGVVVNGEFNLEFDFPERIERVAPEADNPSKVLVTMEYKTFEYDLATGQSSEILIGGKPTYKATILGQQIISVSTQGFDRRLIESSTFERVPVG